MMSPYRSYTLGTNPPFVYVPCAVTVVPVSRHEVGSRIEEDGPLLPSAVIWLADSTEIGSCRTGAAPIARGVLVAAAFLALFAAAAGGEACLLAGPQLATRKVPSVVTAARAAKLIE